MQEILPDGGLASFQNEVSKLADLGRYEDAYIVHAAEGETIVPMAVFDENPRLKAMLFAQMRGMGIDPQRYIVGSEFNSINPITGQPEFFLKKIFKEAKKAVKKLAPYAGTIAGIAGMGPWASAAIGAGVPLLMGEDMSAAIAGGLGGYGAGSAMGTAKMFGGKDDDYALAKLFGDQGGIGPAFNQVKHNLGFGKATSGTQLTAKQAEIAGEGAKVGDSVSKLTDSQADRLMNRGFEFKHGELINPASAANWAPWLKAGSAFAPAIVEGLKQDDSPMGMPHGWDNIYPSSPWYGNWAAPGTIDAMAAGNADGGIIQKFNQGSGEEGVVDIDLDSLTWGQRQEYEDLIKLRDYSPTDAFLTARSMDLNTGGIVQLAEGTGLRGVHPGTEEPGIKGTEDAVPALLSNRLQEEQDKQTMPYGEMMNKQMMNFLIEEFEQGPTDFERKYGNKVTETIRRILGVRTKEDLARDQGAIFGDNSSEIVGYNIANGGIINSYNKDQEYTESKYADGGIAHLSAGAFPRMTGAIAGPGGPKDDMVPAMLSDGEFVMTADAVRNAGGGSRREGARRMYQLMNQLEQGAMV